MKVGNLSILCLAAAIYPAAASAQLRFCNRTGEKVQVAIAYSQRDAPGTTTNGHQGVMGVGWYSFGPGECAKVSDIHVGNHWTYFHAHGDGRSWDGPSRICVPTNRFATGVRFMQQGEGCPAGSRPRGFRQIATNTRGYTMNLNP